MSPTVQLLVASVGYGTATLVVAAALTWLHSNWWR